jgi:hypothetical protein
MGLMMIRTRCVYVGDSNRLAGYVVLRLCICTVSVVLQALNCVACC